MGVRTRITAQARARGLTAAALARRMGWYPSNVSAMDAGRRTISMRQLARLARVLGCSPSDLLEVTWADDTPVFRRRQLRRRLEARDVGTPDGLEKSWVHATQLAWQRHYRIRSRRS
jgi:transcriptional regulator with XRE-family HTH domain